GLLMRSGRRLARFGKVRLRHISNIRRLFTDFPEALVGAEATPIQRAEVVAALGDELSPFNGDLPLLRLLRRHVRRLKTHNLLAIAATDDLAFGAQDTFPSLREYQRRYGIDLRLYELRGPHDLMLYGPEAVRSAELVAAFVAGRLSDASV